MKLKNMAGLNALLAIAMLAAACTPAAAPTPTLDPNVLYTAAAQTVVAQLTQNAPPPTPIPTNTPAPTATLGALPTIPPLGTLAPLKTSTQALSAGGDKCTYITQSPADGSTVKTNQTFNITWRIRNTGTTTWTPEYMYRFYAAVNKLGTQQSGYELSKNVPPGADVDLIVTATASGSAGNYDTTWVLTNPQGVNFCNFNLKIGVTAGAGGVEATAKPAAESKMITYDETFLDGKFAGGTTANFTHTDGDAYQARVLFRTDPSYTGTLYATGNNGVPQPGNMNAAAVGTGTVYFGITMGIPYDFKIEKPDPLYRVYQVDVCVTNVACW